MRVMLDSLRKAVADQNWYPAIAFALTLPDICGGAEGGTGRPRYVSWCDRYLVPIYTRPVGHLREMVVFMTGDDCYALRCAYLHAGDFSVDDKRAILARFLFIVSQDGYAHMNRANDTLQLDVATFCMEMCDAVEHWLEDVAGDAAVQRRLAELATIYAGMPSRF